MKSGSWLQNYPHFLEVIYLIALRILSALDPLVNRLGYARFDRWLLPPEEISKRLLFDCQMCGQCVLHSTGMTCPMTCPKNLRNGPCGGVRIDGRCEVIPEMDCIWVSAFERSKSMPDFGREMMHLLPPLDHQLEGTSAWINMLSGYETAQLAGWDEAAIPPLINIDDIETWNPKLSQTAA